MRVLATAGVSLLALFGCVYAPDSSDLELLTHWPGAAQVVVADPGGLFGENLSGLHYEAGTGDPLTGTLWGVRNGPSTLYRLQWDGARWVPDGSAGWASGKNLRYPDGTGVPDAEGVTKVNVGSWAGVYIATERNNEEREVSRNSVLRFDPAHPGAELVATHEWNLTADLPPTGPNRGIEAITWIPEAFLNGSAYSPAPGHAHGGGLFLVGVEDTGTLHLFLLDHETGTHRAIAELETGLPAIMGLAFDSELGEVWAACDNVCDGQIAILRLNAEGRFHLARTLQRPAGMPNLNNEGITFAPLAECRDGVRSFFWTDDDETDGHSIRMGALTCP